MWHREEIRAADLVRSFEVRPRVFSVCFHIPLRKATVRNWRMPPLEDFMEYLTREKDKLVQMGTIKSTKDQSLAAGVSK